jgi:hypothetical protein
MAVRIAAVSLLLFIFAASASAQSWELRQNVPDPFCNTPGSTTVEFAVSQSAEVLVEVWSPDTTQVVRTLVHAMLAAGLHAVAWDGKDDALVVLPEGVYPYSFTALEPGTGGLLFSDMRSATIACTTPTEPETWSRVKARYRDDK